MKMTARPFDTSLSVEEKQIDLIRKSTVAKHVSIVRSLSQTTMQLSMRAISRANPLLSKREVNLTFVAYHYGEDLANRLRSYMEQRKL